jgi:hypothetical protein
MDKMAFIALVFDMEDDDCACFKSIADGSPFTDIGLGLKFS